MCYDDRIMLDIAVASDAAIISNDNYNDLAAKKPGKSVSLHKLKCDELLIHCNFHVFQNGMS